MRELLLSESAKSTIEKSASTSHPSETGGVLLGVRTGRSPWITHAVEVESATRGPRHYCLPAGSTTALVDEMRRVDSRLGYMGEWHVHPADVGPSPTDRATMRALAKRQNGRSRHPILIVARRCGKTYMLDARQWKWRVVHRMQIVSTGELGSPSSQANT